WLASGCGRHPPPAQELTAAQIVIDHRNESSGGDVWEPTISSVFEKEITLVKNETVTIETRDVQLDGDPVLHLLGPDTSSHGPAAQVAMDDDSGGERRARIRYTPTRTAVYRVVLRASGSNRGGYCALYKDGEPWVSFAPFGGAQRRYLDLHAGET